MLLLFQNFFFLCKGVALLASKILYLWFIRQILQQFCTHNPLRYIEALKTMNLATRIYIFPSLQKEYILRILMGQLLLIKTPYCVWFLE